MEGTLDAKTIADVKYPYLHKLFSVLLCDMMINEVLAGYLVGVANVLLERKPVELMTFLMENPIYIDKMV